MYLYVYTSERDSALLLRFVEGTSLGNVLLNLQLDNILNALLVGFGAGIGYMTPATAQVSSTAAHSLARRVSNVQVFDSILVLEKFEVSGKQASGTFPVSCGIGAVGSVIITAQLCYLTV